MQFETEIASEIPRICCKEHGIKSIRLPWAEKHSRFTLLFESFALRVLQISRSVEEARKLLGLNWQQLNTVKRRGLERGELTMTPEAIELGKNAFVSDQRVFLPVDTDREIKSLQKQGETNGRNNSPDSQASQMDAVEYSIINNIAKAAEQTRSALNKHFTEISERLMEAVRTHNPEALTTTIATMPRRLEEHLNSMFSEFETESAIKRPAWRDAKKEYKDFRDKNKLTRIPDYQPLMNSIRLFIIIIVVEAVLNATLLWEFTGILAALGQTALITAVNVLFGAALVGLCFRYKNHVSWTTRWLTLICVPVILAVLIFNLGVGHYRDALVEAIAQENQLSAPLNWDDANIAESVEIIIDHTRKAMESMRTSPLGIESILSGLLIIVGIGFFGFATWKWYFMHDPYPGYKTRDLARKHTNEDYKKLVKTTRKKMELKIDDANDRIADERTKIINMRIEHDNLEIIARTLVQCYADWIVVLGVTQNYLLAVYRDSNRQARSEPAPAHFDTETPIQNAFTGRVEFTLPELNNVNEVVEAVTDAEGETQSIADEIWQNFNRLVNMQTESDEPQLS